MLYFERQKPIKPRSVNNTTNCRHPIQHTAKEIYLRMLIHSKNAKIEIRSGRKTDAIVESLTTRYACHTGSSAIEERALSRANWYKIK